MTKRATAKRHGRHASSTAVNVHGAMKTRARVPRVGRRAPGVTLAERAYQAVRDEILARA